MTCITPEAEGLIRRVGREVLAIPGQRGLDARGQLLQLVLNKAHPLAAKVRPALQQLLAKQKMWVCLGEI